MAQPNATVKIAVEHPNNGTYTYYFEFYRKQSSGGAILQTHTASVNLFSNTPFEKPEITFSLPVFFHYDYTVQRTCAGGGWTPIGSFFHNFNTWTSVGGQFCSYFNFVAPTTTVGSVATNSAVVNIGGTMYSANYNHFNAIYKQVGASAWNATTETSTLNPITISGLTSNKAYEYHIRHRVSMTNPAGCSNNIIGTTVFSPKGTFRTRINNLNITNITSTSAQLTWNSASTDCFNKFEIEYKKAAATTWTIVVINAGGSYTLAGLCPNTEYNWRVRARCDSPTTSFGPYSTGANFTTAAVPVPTSRYETIGYRKAILGWTNPGPVTLRYRASGTTTWTTINSIPSSAYQVNGLQPATTYEWQVLANGTCGQNSSYSGSRNFTTLSANSLVVTGLTVGDRGYTQAKVSWTGTTGYTYKIQRSSSGVSWAEFPTTATAYTLTGLLPGYNNTWGIRVFHTSSIANDTITGPYIAGPSFQTQLCSPPSFILGGGIVDYTTGTINWFNGSGSLNTDVEFKPNSSSVWNTTLGLNLTNQSSLHLTELPVGSRIDYRGKSSCSGTFGSITETYESPYSGHYFYTRTCPQFTPHITSSITQNNATLNIGFYEEYLSSSPYAPFGSPITINIRYRQTGTSTWTTVNRPIPEPVVVNHPDFVYGEYYWMASYNLNHTLSGLLPMTTYEWQVQTQCSPTVTTTWLQGSNFTTLSTICNVSNISAYIDAQTFGERHAYVSWSATPGTTQYEVKLFCGVSNPSTYLTSSTGFHFTWLNYPQRYVVGVRPYSCPSGTTLGGWKYLEFFTTEYEFSDGSYGPSNSTTYTCAGSNLAGIEDDLQVLSDAMPDMPITPVTSSLDNNIQPLPFFNGLALFPNPAKEKVNVFFETQGNEPIRLYVLDAVGRQVYYRTHDAFSGANNIEMDISLWPQGIYFIHLHTDRHKLTKKLIVGQ